MPSPNAWDNVSVTAGLVGRVVRMSGLTGSDVEAALTVGVAAAGPVVVGATVAKEPVAAGALSEKVELLDVDVLETTGSLELDALTVAAPNP